MSLFMSKARRRSLAVGASAAVVALALAACSSGGGGGGTTSAETSPAATSAAATDGATTPAPPPATGGKDKSDSSAGYQIDCTPYQQFGDLTGKSVSVYASITDVEGDAQQASYKPFEDCTGVTINYEGNREFEAQILIRLQGGTQPDIAYIPQPGLLSTIVNDFPSAVVAAPQSVSDNVDKWFNSTWKGYGTVNNTFYAAPLGANAKSFIWYSPKEFAAKGYTVPTTWTELMDLTKKMQQDVGGPVWCAGVGSGDATGWPGTDWIEDVMLRTAGVDQYVKWYTHQIPFNDPSVKNAFDVAGSILLNPDYVNAGFGGPSSIATTPWTDAGFGLLDGTCLLHRAANFYAANFPTGTNIGPDGDVYAFYFPTDQTDVKPVLGGGEFVLAFSDRPEVQAFQTFLASADWANSKATSTPDGGWISANTGLDVSLLKSPIDQLSAQTLSDPKAVVAFDASDMMPGAVGAGTFWTGIVDWLTGTPTDTVLNTIEASWPAS
jgi:alpha-glucoside transport system substrate-binding protein